jgi:soluble lytic murein transglycosylase-like protein
VLLGCPGHQIREVQYGIEIASNRTGIGGVLLSTLLYTESNFKRDAISPKGYRGIGQTPTATMKYVEVDILHGAMILRDKLRLTNGNMFEALALYKGGNNPVAKKQARQVIQIYNEVVKAVG